MVNVETGDRTVNGNVDYNSELGKITTDIKNLVDDPVENDANAKKNLEASLNKEFLSGIAEFLNKPGNEGQKTELVNSVKKVLTKHKDDENFQTEYKSLLDLATALEIDYTSEEQVAEDEAKSGPQRPDDLNFQGEITDVPPPTDEQKQNRKFHNNINKKSDNAPEGSKSQVEKVEDTINNKYLKGIDELLSSGLDDSQKANLDQIKKDLNNILNIMGNPDKTNTQKLQDFIFANLDENYKEQFNIDNHFREGRGFDGDFGGKTLEGLDKVLRKIEGYINSLRNYLKAIDDNKKNEILDNLKNGEKTFKKGGTPEEFIASLNLSEGVTATFASDEEEDKLNNERAKEIKLKVTIGDKTEEVTVKLKITSDGTDVDTTTTTESAGDGAVDSTPEGQVISTEPITVEGGQHLVMSNSNQLASKYNLDGATFYSASSAEGEPAEGEQAQPQLAENTEMEDGEYVYYIKFNGMPNTYKIRVNEQGGLFPITTEYNSFVDRLETRALIKNNDCCVNYLKDKLGIPGISVQRNGGVNDYTIRSFGKELTIEPMTMDKQWVSKDLGVCLRMLNLTNYLTSGVNEELKGTDPNLRMRGDKLQVQTIKGWKNISEETIRNFGLAGVDDGDMRRFIRYNNHEDWNDNWDTKKTNRTYKKLDISGRAQIIGGSQAVGQAFGSRFSTGSTGVGAVSADVVPTQADGAPTSNEVRGESLKQEELSLLLVGVKFDDLGTMQESGSGYKIFEFNNVKTEGVKEGENSGNTESGDESSDKSGNKYIEIGGNKFMEATENYTGLGYKVDENWVYIGEFEDGRRNGMGIQTPSNTQGIGEGEFTWSCGDKYIGEWKNDQMTKGTCTWTNGDKYEGEWENGKMTREGTYTWASNGNKYEGEWENGKMTGEGTYTWTENGGKFVGKFEDGKMVSGKFVLSDKEYEIVKVEENSLMRIVGGPSDVGKYIDWNVDDGPKIVDGPTSS